MQLPKAECVSVASAINMNYRAQFEGKTKGRIAVGDSAHTFKISVFNEYHITGRRRLEWVKDSTSL